MNFKVFIRLSKISIQKAISYRSSSIIMFIVVLQFFLLEIFSGFVFYSYTDSIAGFSRMEYFNLVVTSNIITAAYYTFFVEGFNNIYFGVVNGELDYLFIKPINSFWYNIFNGISLQDMINLLMYILFQIYLFIYQDINLLNIIFYFIFIIIGIWYTTLFNYLILMLVFRFEKADSILGIPEMLDLLASKPKNIYPRIIQFIFIFIISYFMVYNTPIDILKGNINLLNIFIYLIMTIIFTFIVYKLWFITIRWYQSAN